MMHMKFSIVPVRKKVTDTAVQKVFFKMYNIKKETSITSKSEIFQRAHNFLYMTRNNL